jgi:hypothetical protein
MTKTQQHKFCNMYAKSTKSPEWLNTSNLREYFAKIAFIKPVNN